MDRREAAAVSAHFKQLKLVRAGPVATGANLGAARGEVGPAPTEWLAGAVAAAGRIAAATAVAARRRPPCTGSHASSGSSRE